MRRVIPLLLWLIIVLSPTSGESPPPRPLLVSTFSIVAIDPATGDLGVAVASHYFSVGSVVPWAEAGVGAVATQANVNVGYGPRALDLLKQGLTAQQVVGELLEEDKFEDKDGRQVAIIDAKGAIATFTGPHAPKWAGHRQGKTWSAQGNLLVGPEVIEGMGRGFDATEGELAEKLYAALKAGDAAGGDSRGRQSASMLVVGKQRGRNINNDRYIFINVDDNPQSLIELRRLLDLNLAYLYQDKAYKLLSAGKVTEGRNALAKATIYSTGSDTHLRMGFLNYLAGDKNAALAEFLKAKALEADFEKLWKNTLLGRPAFRPILSDKEFLNKLFPQK